MPPFRVSPQDNREAFINLNKGGFTVRLTAQELEQMKSVAKNLYCFNIGGVGVKIEFAEGGPSLQDTLTDYLIRQKSGL